MKALKTLVVAGVSTLLLATAASANCVVDRDGDPVVDRDGDPIVDRTGSSNCGDETVAATRTKTVLSGDVTFGVNSAVIRPAAYPFLDKIAAQLVASNVAQNVVGHTDSTGSSALNDALSLRRSKAVANYLVRKGVPAANLSVSAAGENQPTASNNNAGGRAQNRRVEIATR